MALIYNCPNCNEKMVVRFLQVGEISQCKSCNTKSVVPDDALEELDENVIRNQHVSRSDVHAIKEGQFRDKYNDDLNNDLIDFNPFEEIRIRSFVVVYLFASIFAGFILGFFFSDGTGLGNLTSYKSIFLLCITYFTILAWSSHHFKILEIDLTRIVGKTKFNGNWLIVFYTFAIYILFEIGIINLVLFLISYVDISVFEKVSSDLVKDTLYFDYNMPMPILNILLFSLVAVLLAPLIEEFFFRGVVLHRWAIKWNLNIALITSSLLFSLFHPLLHMIPIFCFGLISAILYIKFGNLIVSILLHFFNNLLVVFLIFYKTNQDENTIISIESVRSDIWIATIFLIISVPLLIRFFLQNWPDKDTQLPYFRNQVLNGGLSD